MQCIPLEISMQGHTGYTVNFWWNIMDLVLVKVIGCKVISLVRTIFAGQNVDLKARVRVPLKLIRNSVHCFKVSAGNTPSFPPGPSRPPSAPTSTGWGRPGGSSRAQSSSTRPPGPTDLWPPTTNTNPSTLATDTGHYKSSSEIDLHFKMY